MTVTDISTEIYYDLGSPTTTTIPTIAFWVRAKVGELNNLLFENFTINSSYEIVSGETEIPIEAVAVLKKLYNVYNYDVQIRTHMSAVTTDGVLEVTDDWGSSVKKVNRNEISKTFASLKKEEEAGLNRLISAYKQRLSLPSQVAGDDTEVGSYDRNNSIYPRSRY